MSEALEIIFRSGWTFLGTWVLLGVATAGVAAIVRAWRFGK